MPAQKRSSSENNINGGGGGGGGGDEEESFHQHYSRKQSRLEQQPQAQQLQLQQEQQEQQQNDEEEEQEADAKEEEEEEDDDSDGSVTDPEEITEYITVKLSNIRKDAHHARSDFMPLFEVGVNKLCPICLGIIKKTRTVMECMHRFCRECIDKSMRMGNNECPACRTHCASRRSLRDDPRYDALIEALYPDIEKYEEEELTFHEEERNRNKQIQASIAEISRRQSEALVKRRPGRDSGAASTSRIPRSCRNAYSRKRRNNRSNEIQGSDDNEDEFDHGGNNDYSSDELGTEIKQRRRQIRTGGRPSQPSPSAANSDGGYFENETESRTSPGPVHNRELTWGRGGARSHTRHRIANGRGARTRLSKLVDYLCSLKENDNELDVHLMLVPLSKQKTPSLQQPYLSCWPSLTIKHLCEHVANEMSLQAEEVQMVLETPAVGDKQSTVNNRASFNVPNSLFQVLHGQDTLARVEDTVNSNKDHLSLSYKQKEAI